MPADPIKVLLADDHTLFRDGLAGLLASYGGIEVVGSTSNGEEAVTLAERTRPDVVLMQVQIPFERTKDILARMRAVSPPPKVVIVTMFTPGLRRIIGPKWCERLGPAAPQDPQTGEDASLLVRRPKRRSNPQRAPFWSPRPWSGRPSSRRRWRGGA